MRINGLGTNQYYFTSLGVKIGGAVTSEQLATQPQIRCKTFAQAIFQRAVWIRGHLYPQGTGQSSQYVIEVSNGGEDSLKVTGRFTASPQQTPTTMSIGSYGANGLPAGVRIIYRAAF